MNNLIKIRKGLNIRLIGEANKTLSGDIISGTFAVRPSDFVGLNPKLTVKEGDKIRAGEIIFHDKYISDIKIASPSSGEIVSIVRGDKRKILEIIIKADSSPAINFSVPQVKDFNRENISNLFIDAGIFPFFKQRPYGTLVNPSDNPRDIFISFFDSAPLAADFDFVLKDKISEINIALQALKLLTQGDVYASFSPKSAIAGIIGKDAGVKINYFDGPHPAGLTGVQINKIRPINKGEIVWTIKATDLVLIGNLLLTGNFSAERIIAVAGSEVKEPSYYKTFAGADLSQLKQGMLKSENVRIISGNVLTGTNISQSPYLGYNDNLVTIIPEGNKFEMFGWMMPGFSKFSNSGTFLSGILPWKKFKIDTNLHGGHRSYVVTGEYEKVCPMDIYPQLLIKAILAENIDKMEQLGIYEVIEEDFALCEFVCTSKTDVQDILRKGLELIKNEMA